MEPLDFVPRLTVHPDWPQALALTAVLCTVALLVMKAKKVAVYLHGKTSVAVAFGWAAASGFTGFSADSSYRFAGKMGMHSHYERGLLFSVTEIGLLALVFMARQNLNGPDHTPGTPGTVVKVLVGVQIIPAFVISESFWVGLVRAFIGPIMAMVMWHQVLGIELKHKKPEAENKSAFNQIAKALRERAFAYLGLAERNQSALEINQNRYMRLAVDLYAELEILEEVEKPGRLARRAKVKKNRKAARYASKACEGDVARRRKLKLLLAERRQARKLATMRLDEVWASAEVDSPDAHALAVQTRTVFREGVLNAYNDPLPIPAPRKRPELAPVDGVSLEEMAADLKARNHGAPPRLPAAPVAPGGVLFTDIDERLLTEQPAPVEDEPDPEPEPEPDDDPDPEPPAREPVPDQNTEPAARPHPEPAETPAPVEEPERELTPAGESNTAPEDEPDEEEEPQEQPAEPPADRELKPREAQKKLKEDARTAYRESKENGKPLTREELMVMFSRGERWTEGIMAEVNRELKAKNTGRRLRAVAND